MENLHKLLSKLLSSEGVYNFKRRRGEVVEYCCCILQENPELDPELRIKGVPTGVTFRNTSNINLLFLNAHKIINHPVKAPKVTISTLSDVDLSCLDSAVWNFLNIPMGNRVRNPMSTELYNLLSSIVTNAYYLVEEGTVGDIYSAISSIHASRPMLQNILAAFENSEWEINFMCNDNYDMDMDGYTLLLESLTKKPEGAVLQEAITTYVIT